MHIHNIYKEGELNKEATVKDFLIVQNEGGRQVARRVSYYNLDVIISVGYRVKSQAGTRFRQWATKILKDYMLCGYVDATTFDILDVRAKGVIADIYSDSDYKSLRDMHNISAGKQPVTTHKWSTVSHDRWLIIDDTLYHCGHSFKDMGKKLCAITRMGACPEDILKLIR